MTRSQDNKAPWYSAFVRISIIVCIFVLLLTFPRTPPLSTSSTWSLGFPLHPFAWSTYWENIRGVYQHVTSCRLGQTLDDQSIWVLVSARFVQSFVLLSLALAWTFILGSLKGIYDGLHTIESTTGSACSSIIQWITESIPEFFLIFGLELLGFYLNSLGWKVYFIGSHVFWSGTLVPSVLLSLMPMMYMSRIVKESVASQLGQLYIQTARSKGLSPTTILRKHILVNCLHAVSKSLASVLGILFSGLVIIEYLFSRNGIGSGFFYAMGHDGVSPIYGVPLGHPPLAEGHPFDVNLCFTYALAMGAVFAVFWLGLQLVLRLLGHRGTSSTYASSFHETTSGRRVSIPFLLGCVMFLVLLLLGIFASHLPLANPMQMDVLHTDANGALSTPPYPPSPQHWFGTDADGRDLLSRCVYGTLPTFTYVAVTDAVILLLGACLATMSSSFHFRFVRSVIQLWHTLTQFIPGVMIALLVLEIPNIYWAGVHITDGEVTWGRIHEVLFMAVLTLIEGSRVAKRFQVALDEEHQRSYMEAAMVSGNSNWTRFWLYDLAPLRDAWIEEGIVTFLRLILVMATLGFFQDVFHPTWLKVNFNSWDFSGTSLDWGSLFAQNSRDFIVAPWVMFPSSVFVAWTAISLQLIQSGVRRFLTTNPSRSPSGVRFGYRIVRTTLWLHRFLAVRNMQRMSQTNETVSPK